MCAAELRWIAKLSNDSQFLTLKVFAAAAQYIDPVVGLLAPATLPASLYTIRGPIYVEPASLQPPLLAPVVGPPLVGPPVVSSAVVSPSPYNPYVPNYPISVLWDEQADDVSSNTKRRFNTNVQSGIQQLGSNNMNLQGNIQQVSRRSLQQQRQASQG